LFEVDNITNVNDCKRAKHQYRSKHGKFDTSNPVSLAFCGLLGVQTFTISLGCRKVESLSDSRYPVHVIHHKRYRRCHSGRRPAALRPVDLKK
jgi:hypothetical protein